MVSPTSAAALSMIKRSITHSRSTLQKNLILNTANRCVVRDQAENISQIHSSSLSRSFYGVNNELISSTSPRLHFTSNRLLSTASGGKTASKEEETSEEIPTDDNDKNSETPPEKEPEEETPEQKLQKQVKDLKDKLLRSLAEQENIRNIAKKDVESARNFAVTSFAKSLLDTSDNLSRAMDAVPEEYRNDKENHNVLATLFEGIKMTDDGLTKAFEKNGLKKYGKVGDVFDPNLHDALFEYPDPKMTPGTLGQVMKAGFLLNGRAIRAAEVGVVKKP